MEDPGKMQDPGKMADRYNNPGYKNWLRVGIALLVTRDGLKNVTLQAANKLHAELKLKLGASVENCTCNTKKGQECKDCVPWRQELETYYSGDVKRMGWSNCTPSKWSNEPWEVAKVFMSKDPTAAADNTGPEKSDPSALLKFLIHCTYCKKYVSVKPSQKVIEVRNETMHSKDLTLDRQTFNEYMDKMDRLLRLVKDPLTLAADTVAQKAADEVLKIKKGQFHIGDNKACLDAEVGVFREFMGQQEKLLHKEQLEDHGTRLDSLGTEEQKNIFTSALTVSYSNTLKTLEPLPWNYRFCLDLDQIFTCLELVGHRDNEDRSTGIMLKSLDDVFHHHPESGQSKRFNVLVVGDAGSGKSTLLSKTALDWSRKKGRLADMNKIVLLIRLREVEPGESIAQIVLDQCVTESAKGISISSIEACLQDYESDVVFLLDGYDELVPDAKEPKQAVPQLLAKTQCPDCTVIITSRPFADIERYMAVNCQVNVMGFSSDHVDKYVPLYFESVGKQDLADSLVKALDSRANVVARDLIQTPMFLMLICVLWEENPTIVQFPVTMSGLYWELLICVIRKYSVREGLPMSNDEIPPVVSAALLQLGKFALEALLRGESLVDLGEMTTNQDTDAMVNLGVVSKEVSASRLHPRKQLNFPHKSMQEFLAARYVADGVNTSSDDLHSLVPLHTVSAVLHCSNLVQFICGCGGKVASELLASLSKLYVAEENNKALKHLCLMSLYEGNNPQHFPILSTVLSSLDVDINIPSRKGAALKYYLDHATAVPEGRSLKLTVAESHKGDAVEYLSSLVEKPLPDLHLYLALSFEEEEEEVEMEEEEIEEEEMEDEGDREEEEKEEEQEEQEEKEGLFCYIGNMLRKLIPFFTNVPNMHSLDLTQTGLTPESIQALGQILPKLTMLEKLDLSQNNIGNEELEPFAAIQQPVASLKVLNLSHNKMGDVCLRSLAAVLHHLSCLEELDLSQNNIGNEELEPFAAIQQPVASLKVLNLFHNKMGDVCLRSLAAVLHHLSCLERLNLSDNNIGDEGLEPFAAIQQPVVSLKVLNLSRNKIGDVCLRSLAAVLHCLSCLEDLNLRFNNIGDEGLEPFAAIQQPVASLKKLDLSWNKIGDVCLGSLAAVLHHVSSLLDLDLSHNNIGDAEVAYLAATLHDAPTLKYVRLGGNPITAVGLQSFAETILEMPALKQLYLDPQETAHLDDTAAKSICTMLARLPVLRHLYLRNICMQAAGFQAVDTAAEEHPTLETLHFSRKCVPLGVNTRSSKIDLQPW